MSNIALPYRPTNGEPRSIAGILNDFDTCRDVINGNLDNGNLDAVAAIPDSKLATPVNTHWRLIGSIAAGFRVIQGISLVNNYYITQDGNLRQMGFGDSRPPEMFRVVNADYAVAGKTTKYMLRTWLHISMSLISGGAGFSPRMGNPTIGGTGGVLHVTALANPVTPWVKGTLSDGFFVPYVIVTTDGSGFGYDGVIMLMAQLWVMNE